MLFLPQERQALPVRDEKDPMLRVCDRRGRSCDVTSSLLSSVVALLSSCRFC